MSLYRCIKAFTHNPDSVRNPDGKKEISLRLEDDIEIDDHQLGNDDDVFTPTCIQYVFGHNLTTGESGVFPLLNVVKKSQFPSPVLIRKSDVNKDSLSESTSSSPGAAVPQIPHRCITVSVSSPHLCYLCQDFVMTPFLSVKQCTRCRRLFHFRCFRTVTARHTSCTITSSSSTSSSHIALGSTPVDLSSGDGFMFSGSDEHAVHALRTEQPLETWTVDQILQWLAINGMGRYIEVFRRLNVNGFVLSNFNESCTVHQYIADPFQLKSIQYAVDVLKGSKPHPGNIEVEAFLPSDKKHEPRLLSFMKDVFCSCCGEPLIGVRKQGYQCIDCGCILHRICLAQDNIRPCFPNQAIASQISTVFGVPLERQVLDEKLKIPTFLIHLLHNFEKRGVQLDADLFDALRKSAQSCEMARLCQEFNYGVSGPDDPLLDEHSLIEIAKIIKWYLRELPEPLIPTVVYDALISCNDDRAMFSIIRSLEQKPNLRIHYNSLVFVMEHYYRVFKHQQKLVSKTLMPRMTSTGSSSSLSQQTTSPSANNTLTRMTNPMAKWSQVMAQIILQPPWATCYVMKDGLDTHIRILETLLFNIHQWGPDSKIEIPPELAESDWYWADVTKEEVNVMMSGLPDGSFMVRDASSKSDGFTLTLRQCGVNKLIRIYHRDGRYGFVDPPDRFKSVVELIQYYQNYSLIEYNKQLDLKLTNPVSKHHHLFGRDQASKVDDVGLVLQLKSIDEELRTKSDSIEEDVKRRDEYKQEIEDCTRMIKIYSRLKEWFNQQYDTVKDQVTLPENFDFKDRLDSQVIEVQQRLQSINAELGVLESRKEAINHELLLINESLCLTRPEVEKLNKKQQQITRLLRDRGVSDEDFHYDNQDTDKNDQVYIRLKAKVCDSFPLRRRETWFVDCGRNDSDKLLYNRPTGTFLLRPSKRYKNKFTLVVKLENNIEHCLIHRSDSGKYGFVETNCIFDSLESLVLHYHFQSLLQHNDSLNTTLRYPVYANQSEVDEYHSLDSISTTSARSSNMSATHM